MQKGYFAAARGDIVNSPGWFSKLLRLSLVCFIPIFGVIVVFGYLYGWARDIAWNVHRPMGERILGNEDGNLYKRGFYILVIILVCSLAPEFFSLLTSFATGFSFGTSMSVNVLGGGLFFVSFTTIMGLFLSFFIQFFVYVGSMRTSIYATLSSGFQISKIWAMMRYDFPGLLRIFVMNLVVGLVACCIVGVIACILVFFEIAFITALHESSAVVLAIPLGVCFLVFGTLVFFYVWMFTEALVSRALGYWTRQFEVSSWGGQEDLMPFERRIFVPVDPYHQTYAGANPYQGCPPCGDVQGSAFQQTQGSSVDQTVQNKPQGDTACTAESSEISERTDGSVADSDRQEQHDEEKSDEGAFKAH